jgi:hypothetical protein
VLPPNDGQPESAVRLRVIDAASVQNTDESLVGRRQHFDEHLAGGFGADRRVIETLGWMRAERHAFEPDLPTDRRRRNGDR